MSFWLHVDFVWFVKDRQYLYLIMEFCPGGDFLSLLRTHHKLSESDTRFYMAVIALYFCFFVLFHINLYIRVDNRTKYDPHITVMDTTIYPSQTQTT